MYYQAKDVLTSKERRIFVIITVGNKVTAISYADLYQNLNKSFELREFAGIDQGTVDTFANLTKDWQWIHVDVERATRELGGTIAHGYLVLSLVPSMMHQLVRFTGVGRALNYGTNRVRFTAPVFVGQKLTAKMSIIAVEPKGNGILLTMLFVIGVSGEKRPSCTVEKLMLLFSGDGTL